MSKQPTSKDSARLPSRAVRRLRKSVSAWVGATLVVLLIGMALCAGWLAPYAPNHRDGQNVAPSAAHPLGTDANEYDVLTRVMYGARLSLLAGLISIGVAIAVGVPAGLLAGYAGGWVDAVLMRGIDVMLAFPSILIALLIASSLGMGWTAVIVAVGLINVPIFARQVRATLLTVRNLEYVAASRALGARPGYLMIRVMAPSLVSPILVLGTLGLGSAILEVAGLSFLGLAGDPSAPEWGNMLAEAKDYIHSSIWPAVAPGVAISLTILGFNLLGDGLRDALDPRLEGGK